jgi:hypothetical protein
MVFAIPEYSVIMMKFCGRQARWQKLMPPRYKATAHTAGPLCLSGTARFWINLTQYQAFTRRDRFRLNITQRIEFALNRDKFCPLNGTQSSGLLYRDI